MNGDQIYLEKGFRGRLFLSALAFAVFAAAIIDVMLPLLLTDIAKTFEVPVGTAATISSISAIVGVVIGLLLAVLNVRFKPKSVLVAGVLCISIAAMGSYLAPSLLFMQAIYSLNGVGSVMIGATALALIGEVYPPEKKGRAVGWIVAAGFLAFSVGAPMTGLLTNFGTWRTVMLWFNLPVSIGSLLFAFAVLPSKKIEIRSKQRMPPLAGLKQALTNKSAVACLVGIMLASATAAITTFVISFWKYSFSMSTGVGSIITMINATSAAAGGLVAGRLMNRTGRKSLGIAAGFVESIMVFLTFFLPSLALSETVSVVRVWCYGMLSASFASLTLEQIPQFRGTMMSLRSAFLGIGSFIGITIAGTVLNTYSYQAVGIALGTISFSSIIVILLIAKDPLRSKLGDSSPDDYSANNG